MFDLPNIFLSIFSTETKGEVDTRQSSTNRDFSYFNEQAIVDETIYPYQSGRVYYQSSWWPARCEQEIILAPGDMVDVVGIHNITLLVAPTLFNK